MREMKRRSGIYQRRSSLSAEDPFHEDITGKEITSKLLAQAQARENIEIVEYMTMVDLISADNICGGVVAMDEQDEIYEITAPYVVLACGGLGGLYKILPIFRILQEMLWELP